MTHHLVVTRDPRAEENTWDIEGEHSFEECGIWQECSVGISDDDRHPGFDPDEDTFDGDTATVTRHGEEHRYLDGLWAVPAVGCAYTSLDSAQEDNFDLAQSLESGRYEVLLEWDDGWAVRMGQAVVAA